MKRLITGGRSRAAGGAVPCRWISRGGTAGTRANAHSWDPVPLVPLISGFLFIRERRGPFFLFLIPTSIS